MDFATAHVLKIHSHQGAELRHHAHSSLLLLSSHPLASFIPPQETAFITTVLLLLEFQINAIGHTKVFRVYLSYGPQHNVFLDPSALLHVLILGPFPLLALFENFTLCAERRAFYLHSLTWSTHNHPASQHRDTRLAAPGGGGWEGAPGRPRPVRPPRLPRFGARLAAPAVRLGRGTAGLAVYRRGPDKPPTPGRRPYHGAREAGEAEPLQPPASRAACSRGTARGLRPPAQAGPRAVDAHEREEAASPRTRHGGRASHRAPFPSARTALLPAGLTEQRRGRGERGLGRCLRHSPRRRPSPCRCKGTSGKSGPGSLSPPPRPPRYDSPRRPGLKDRVETKMPVLCLSARRGLAAAIVWLPDGEQRLSFSSAERGASAAAEGLTRRLCLREKSCGEAAPSEWPPGRPPRAPLAMFSVSVKPGKVCFFLPDIFILIGVLEFEDCPPPKLTPSPLAILKPDETEFSVDS